MQRVFLRPGTHSLLLRRHGLDVRNTEGPEGMPQAWRELRPGIGGDELRGLVASLARLPTKATWERQDSLAKDSLSEGVRLGSTHPSERPAAVHRGNGLLVCRVEVVVKHITRAGRGVLRSRV